LVVLALFFGWLAAALLLLETTPYPKWKDGRAYGLAFGVLSAICGMICMALSVDFSDGADYSYGFVLLSAAWALMLGGTLAFGYAIRFAAAAARPGSRAAGSGPLYSQLQVEIAR